MATQTRPLKAAHLKYPVTVEQWGELERPPLYELVDGHLVEKPDVALWHDLFLGDLFALIHAFVTAHDLGKVVASTAKLKLSGIRGRCPDIFFIPKEMYHLVGRNLFHGVPPFVVEVISPGSEKTDRDKKFKEYAERGIGQYWIVDCPVRTLEVFKLARSKRRPSKYELTETCEGDAVFKPALFPGLEIDLGSLWPNEFIESDLE